jgi:hypothetical protein
MQPKRDSPGYKKFVQALAEAADVVDVRIGRAGFAEQHVDANAALRVTWRQAGDVISLPRIDAARLVDAGMAEIVQG